MKYWFLLYAGLALAGGLGLLTLIAFPALNAISPKGPMLVPVEGATIENLGLGSIRYQEIGQGDDALLLLHGFNDQISTWNAVLPYIGNCGKVVRIDIPGYGGSTWPSDSYSLSDQATRVVAFMDTRGLSRVTLVGVSMGGSLSAWLAAHYPDRVNALMIMAPSGYPGSLNYGGRFARMYRPGALNRLATRIAASGLYRRRYPDSKMVQALTLTASYDASWASALEKIRTPTLVLWSRGDPAIPFSYAKVVADAIPGSALLPLAPEVGHELTRHRPELIGKLACQLHKGVQPNQILSDMKDLLARNRDG